MDSIYLWQFLAQHGLDRKRVKDWTTTHSISIRNKNNGKTFFPSSEVVRLWPGDIVTLRRQGLETQLKVLSVKVPTEGRNSGIKKWSDGQQLQFWLGMAGVTGLALGGPLSALLAYFAAKLIIREDVRMHGKGNSKILPFRAKAFFTWLAIGSLAFPTSWWITRSLGWNLDVVSVIQSQGKYKSYKDWSEAETAFRKAEEVKQEAKQALKDLKEEQLREDEWRQKVEQERVIAIEKQARLQAEQQAKDARVQQELDEWNDPARRQERDEAHRRHLLSVGCIDEYGQIIRNLFCLNTEAPLQ